MKFRKAKTSEKGLVRAKQYLKNLLEKGLCIWCRQENTDNAGKRWCLGCMQKMRESVSRSRKKRLAEGRCYKCGNPEGVSPVHRHCGDCHRKKTAAAWKVQVDRKAAGLCVRCGKVRDGHSVKHCEGCRLLTNARESKRQRENRERTKRDKV